MDVSTWTWITGACLGLGGVTYDLTGSPALVAAVCGLVLTVVGLLADIAGRKE